MAVATIAITGALIAAIGGIFNSKIFLYIGLALLLAPFLLGGMLVGIPPYVFIIIVAIILLMIMGGKKKR